MSDRRVWLKAISFVFFPFAKNSNSVTHFFRACLALSLPLTKVALPTSAIFNMDKKIPSNTRITAKQTGRMLYKTMYKIIMVWNNFC